MASKEELSEQLAVTQKLAAAVELMSKHMARVESSYDSQITSVEKLTRAIETLRGQDLGELNNTKLDPIKKEFKETEKGVSALSGRIKELGAKLTKKFPTDVAIGAAALMGLEKGVRNTLAVGKGIAGFFASFTEGAISLAASIIAIPFKMFSSLVDMAAAASGGTNELAVALEKLREAMGDLKGPGTHAVLEASKTLKGFSDTGLSTWRVFGTLAERIELVTKFAVAMGATFGVLRKEFEDNGGALFAFQKGLGLSEEGMKALGDRAITMGKPLSRVLLDITKQTINLGKAFDIDQKLIGKDMQKAAIDVKHFGSVTVKEIGQAAVYARKLGLELDKIVGTLDAFETFDAAAENAAKLSQAFGVNIDAFKMMEAQSPAEQLDMLRKSFREAGVDASKFTRQQLALVSQSTGLDAATAKQALSMENYGVSLDDVKKKSENAEKKTMSQADAMSKLADSIERMVKSGGAQSGGFWDMFVKGFLGGIQSSKEFREIIMNIKRSLQLVYIEGVRLGKAFVDLFPGVKQFLGGIADFFRPAKFKTLVKGVVDVIIGWMKDLTDPNGKASFAGLMEKLQEKFFGFFDSSHASGKKMLDGFKTTFKTIAKVAAEGIKWAADKVGEGLSFIIGLVTGKNKLSGGGALGGTLGFLMDVLEPLGDALLHAWTVIAPKLKELVLIVGGKLYDYLTSKEFYEIVKPALPWLAGALFGPAAVSAMAGGIASFFAKAAMKAFTGGDGKEMMNEVATLAAKKATEASTKMMPKSIEGILPPKPAIVGAAESAKGAQASGKGINWGEVIKFFLGLASVIVVGMAAVFGAIFLIRKFEISPKELVMGLSSVGLAATAMLPAALALVLVSKVPIGEKAAAGIAAIGVAIVAMAGVMWLSYKILSELDMSKLKVISEVLFEMSKVFLVASGVVLAATLIGAIFIASAGVGAVAAVAGLTAIGVAVTAIAGISMGIVKELSKLPIDASFQTKVDGFLGIMKSIQALADTLVSVIGLMTPSFAELISGTASSLPDKVKAATSLIGEMIGNKGGGKGIIGIVELVMKSIEDLNVKGPELAASAKTFADVLTAVAAVTAALTPPPEYFSAQTSLVNVLDPTIGKGLDQTVKGYMQEMTKGLSTIVNQIKSSIESMKNIDVPDPEKAAAISGLITSVTGLLKNLTPSPETVSAFSSEVMESAGAWGLFKEKVKKFDGDALASTITTMGDQLGKIMPVLVDNVIVKIIDQAKSLKPEDLEKLKAIGPLMASVSGIVSSMANSLKGKKVTPVEVAGGVAWATEDAPNLKVMFEGLGEVLPDLIKAVIASVEGVKVSSNFGALAKQAEQIFTFLGTIMNIPGQISQAVSGLKISGNIGEGLIKPIGYVAELLDWLIMSKFGKKPLLEEIVSQLKAPVFQQLGSAKSGAGAAAAGLSGLLESISNIVKSIGSMSSSDAPVIDQMKIAQVMGNASVAIDALKVTLPDVAKSLSSLGNIGGVSNSFKQFGIETQKIADAIKDGGIVPAIKAVEEMVKLTQNLDTQLNQLPMFGPVDAKLRAIAGKAGLGGKAVYKVNSKDIVINMHVNVTMDVGEVEKVMIVRANSSIRQRLDFLAENAETKMSPPIMPTGTSYSPAPGAPQALTKSE